uniref:Uncharacterized protein n=1 Tax=Pararge aegeria TaxID=116150 RepID=S4P6G4_9NEOP
MNLEKKENWFKLGQLVDIRESISYITKYLLKMLVYECILLRVLFTVLVCYTFWNFLRFLHEVRRVCPPGLGDLRLPQLDTNSDELLPFYYN